MNIKISGIDPMVVKEIDQRAKDLSKKTGKVISRNEYLKRLIEGSLANDWMKEREDKFDTAIGNLNLTLNRQSDMLRKYIDSNAKVILTLIEEDA